MGVDLSFGLPMEEAQAFWRDKLKMRPKDFAALTAEAKTRAFAIAGIAKGDELDTVYNALGKALSDGISFEQFKAECGDIFTRRGWTGKRAWRVDNIFRTNIQTAYNVGRYQQMQRVKDRRPYWRYSAVNDRRTRPAHRAMHGKVFPADHPFWGQWYPPNGFRCRCSVNSVSEAALEANGWTAESHDPTGELYEPTDPVTGAKLPGRLLMPDPGWSFNPGKAAGLRTEDLLGQKLAAMHPAIASGLLDDLKKGLAPANDARFAEWVRGIHANRTAAGIIKTTGEMRTVWFVEPGTAKSLAGAGGPQLETALITVTDKDLLHAEHLKDLATGEGRSPERIIGMEHVEALPRLIREPRAVLYDKHNNGLLYVFDVDAPGKSGKWAVRVNFTDKRAGITSNAIRSGGYVETGKLGGEQYELLEGGL